VIHVITTKLNRVKHCSKECGEHRGKLHAFWKVAVTIQPLYFLRKSFRCSLDRRLGGHQIQSDRGGGNKIFAPGKNRTAVVKPYSDTSQVFHKRVRPPQNLRYPNPFYTFASHFFEICFNIYLPFRTGFLPWYPPREISYRNYIRFLYSICSAFCLFPSAIAG
jgi:hypothetical protein